MKLEKDSYKIKELPEGFVDRLSEKLDRKLVLIGAGAFSRVFLIEGMAAVIKITKDVTEIKCLLKIKNVTHNNLPKIYNIFKFEEYYVVIMEKLSQTKKLKNEIRIILSTKISINSPRDEFDAEFSKELLNNFEDIEVKEKLISLINEEDSYFISTFLKALAINNKMEPWTNEYKKEFEQIEKLNKTFNKFELLKILREFVLVFKKIEEKFSKHLLEIILSICELLRLDIFHGDIAARNIMKRQNGELVVIDYNLSITT